MKEDMAAATTKNDRKMSLIQEELRASNAKTDAILEILSRMQTFAAAPQPVYPFPAGYLLHDLILGKPSYQPAPDPMSVGTPPPLAMPLDTTNIHNAISTTIGNDKDLRTHVRESSCPTILTPPPPTVGLPSHMDMASFTVIPMFVDRTKGDETA